MAYIYCITNNINGKKYVGKTHLSIQERFKQHCSDRTKRNTENRPLYRAMNKYGINNFSISILEECSFEEASERESYWIKEMNSCYEGYNASLRGITHHKYNYDELAKSYLELGSMNGLAMNNLTKRPRER